MRAWLRSTLASFLGSAGLLIVSVGHAGGTPAEPLKTSCERVRGVPFPEADQPDEVARKALRDCSSERLFYGIGQAVDPVKARMCAYVERAAGDDLVFGGSAILMTIYATGVGARRNPDLAIRLACGLDAAPAEMESRVARLEKLRTEVGGKTAFSLCDDATSGFMQGHCTAHEQRSRQAKRDERHRKRLASWTVPERAAFKKLRATANAFFRARGGNEVDLSGTARSALQTEEEDHLEASFDGILEALERHAIPRASPADLAESDRRLNAVYQQIMKAEEPNWGTVTRDGIRETERQWVKYRDEWAAFAKVKFPGADADPIKAWLTHKRTDMLKAFAPAPP